MRDAIVFAGTSEGRRLYEFCAARQIEALFCVATEYGKEVLIDQYGQQNDEREAADREEILCKSNDGAAQKDRIHVGRLSREEMTALFLEEKPRVVADATHPYAAEATANIREAAERYREAAGIEGQVYYRVLRRLSEENPEPQPCEAADGEYGVTQVPDMTQAAAYLSRTQGNILVTTGSSQIGELCRLLGEPRRLYPRILPDLDALRVCLNSGIPASHMICMQGPFTEEMNVALIRKYNIRYLFTKQSGAAGGFPEKCRAARAEGVRLVVLLPPKEEKGVSAGQMEQILLKESGRL